ncbi:HupE/UreJ family protein [Pseudorhodoferax sp. Leaf267]|uniref:HupE/UreJ family protein n=1 Tax=Pseudorhodoferax sp. Leaf267 TaxID=1736316 RepID=UPI0006F1F1C4|nr:HupE/UreJ family protein [Pseudorhodoferax sp. Leaf267]KQP15003.1 urease accessory protein UreJ [Pseudorhodoferax sp. Leaf267]
MALPVTPPRAFAVLAMLATGAAHAHPGHDTDFAAALAHPFLGLDHLLAMVAVGAWSVLALPAGRRLVGPAVFLALLAAGVALAWWGVVPPGTEAGVALSVALFGGLLLAGAWLPPAAGLALIGVAALLHGSAHGSELAPGAALLATAAGILLGSALLHAIGLAAGTALVRLPIWTRQAAAAALGTAGLAMLATRL